MTKLFSSKKGSGALDTMGQIFVSIVSIAIIMSVGFLIVAETQDQIVSTDGIASEANMSMRTIGYNATVDLQDAMASTISWVDIIVVVLIGAMLIGLVMFFKGKK